MCFAAPGTPPIPGTGVRPRTSTAAMQDGRLVTLGDCAPGPPWIWFRTLAGLGSAPSPPGEAPAMLCVGETVGLALLHAPSCLLPSGIVS